MPYIPNNKYRVRAFARSFAEYSMWISFCLILFFSAELSFVIALFHIHSNLVFVCVLKFSVYGLIIHREREREKEENKTVELQILNYFMFFLSIRRWTACIQMMRVCILLALIRLLSVFSSLYVRMYNVFTVLMLVECIDDTNFARHLAAWNFFFVLFARCSDIVLQFRISKRRNISFALRNASFLEQFFLNFNVPPVFLTACIVKDVHTDRETENKRTKERTTGKGGENLSVAFLCSLNIVANWMAFM